MNPLRLRAPLALIALAALALLAVAALTAPAQSRAKAQQALGSRFDIREFHDVVLRNGSVPLPVLEAEVRVWIGETRART